VYLCVCVYLHFELKEAPKPFSPPLLTKHDISSSQIFVFPTIPSMFFSYSCTIIKAGFRGI